MSEMVELVAQALDGEVNPRAAARVAIAAVRAALFKIVDADQEDRDRDVSDGLDNETAIYCSGQDFVIQLLDAALAD